MSAIRQKRRKMVREFLARAVKTEHLTDFATCCGDPRQSKPHVREQNHTVRAPVPSQRHFDIAQSLNRSAGDIHFLEAAIGKKSDEPTVRRPERENRAVSTGYRFGYGGIHLARP